MMKKKNTGESLKSLNTCKQQQKWKVYQMFWWKLPKIFLLIMGNSSTKNNFL